MLRWLNKGVGRKLWVAAGLPGLCVALSGVFLIRRTAATEVRDATRAHLEALSDIVVSGFAGAQPGPNPHAAVLAAIAADLGSEVKKVEVFDTTGVVKFARDPRLVHTVEPDAIVAGLSGKSYERYGFVKAIVGGQSCAACHASAPGRLGGLHLAVDAPPLAKDLDDLYRTALLFVLFFAVGISAAIALSLRYFVHRPLKRLALAMDRAKRGDFLFRTEVTSEDQVGELAKDFNVMLAAITDLHAKRLEDEQSIASMQRELKLKAQVEAQHRLLDETNRRLERRLRELTLLFDLTRTMNSTLQLDELLKLMTELVGGTLGFNEFVCLLLDEPANELVVKATFGVEGEDLPEAPPEGAISGQRYKVGQGATGWAAQHKQMLLIRDTKQDGRYLHYHGRRMADGSNLSIPMIYKERCVGVLNFFRPIVDAFSEEEIRLLTAVANQAAIAIANARLYQRTVELSLTDALTGVYNRRHLFARLEMEITRAERFDSLVSLVMVDVDHFKHYNDTAGHPAGDEVLKKVASLFAGAVRKVDTVARYGGEEFSIILPRIEKQQAFEVAEKLRKLVAATEFEHGEKQPGGRVTCSMGVASYPADGRALAELVDCADAALYAAKKAGRNNVQVFSEGMRENPGRERDVSVTSKIEQTGT